MTWCFPFSLTHDPTQITAQHGAERLSALSLLAQWVVACDLVHAKDVGQVGLPSNWRTQRSGL